MGLAPKFTYVPPSPQQLDALMSSSGVHDAMTERSQDALEHAQSIAPVVTGEYRDHFHVEPSSGQGQAQAHLVNDDEAAASIEWGNTRGQDGHHVLSQTADWLEAD